MPFLMYAIQSAVPRCRRWAYAHRPLFLAGSDKFLRGRCREIGCARPARGVWSPDFGYIPTDPACRRVAHDAAKAVAKAAELEWVDVDARFSSARTPANRYSAALLRGELELSGDWPAKIEQLSDYIANDMAGAGTLGP